MAKMSATSAAVLDSLAEGEFEYTNTLTSAQQWTAGTEKVIATMGDANKNILVYWRIKFVAYSPQLNEPDIPYQWFVVKADSSAAPDFSTAATLEAWMLDKKIFARGSAVAHAYNLGVAQAVVNLKFFNVTLEPDKFLVFFVLPKITSSAGVMNEWLESESRHLYDI